MNQGIITAGAAIGSLLEGTMLEAIPSPFAYIEFWIMLIIAVRKFYGGSNEASEVKDAISFSPTSVATPLTETNFYPENTTETTTSLVNTSVTSNSSLSLSDQYSILILACFLIVFYKL